VRPRVGFDLRPALLSRAGFARVARELHAALARRDDLQLLPFAAMARRPRPELAIAGLRSPRLPGRLQRALAPLGFGAESLLGPLDVFQYTDLVFPPVRRARTALLLHDLSFLRGEGWHDAGFARRVEPRLRAAAARASAVITGSPRVAKEIVAGGLAPAERVHVVSWGADHISAAPQPDDAARRAALRVRTGLPPDGPLVLLPGTREPRKNQLAALEAFLRVRAAAPGPPAVLLLAGARGWGCEALEARLREPALHGAVGVAGEVDEADLGALLRGADLVFYPSLEEGFGLPVVEALRCGRAVLTSRDSPMADLGGAAVALADPRDADSLARELHALLAQPARRAALGAAAARAVAPLTWDAAAARLAGIYHALAASVDSRP
jgi:glycosyltransferase involved in cell wall biosynthesis